VQALDTGGWALVIISVIGAALHGLGRFIASLKR
jgi:hypothetical protein